MSRLVKVATGEERNRGNVIFVHGLGGDPIETWGGKNLNNPNSDPMFWPAWVASEFSEFAVFSIGYEAAPNRFAGNAMGIVDRANNVLDFLRRSSELKCLREQPTAFICHSLGGLVVKRLIIDALEQRGGNQDLAAIVDKIKQVAFLGTPHEGSGLANVAKLFRIGNAAIRDLEKNNERLRDIGHRYRNIEHFHGIRLDHVVYYEKRKTLTIWPLRKRIVGKDSADPKIAGVIPVGADADHYELTQPTSYDNQVYVGIIDMLKDLPDSYSGAPDPDNERSEKRTRGVYNARITSSENTPELKAYEEACRGFFTEHINGLSDIARGALAKGLREHVSPSAADLLDKGDIDKISSALGPVSVARFIDAVGSALALIKNKTSSASELVSLQELAAAIAPMIAAQHDDEVEKVAHRLGRDGELGYVKLGTGAYTMAEIIVAASQNRPVEMRKYEGPVEDPIGEYALVLGGESGPRDRHGIYGASDIIAEIIARGSSLVDEEMIDEHIQSTANDISKNVWQAVKNRLGYYSDYKAMASLNAMRTFNEPVFYVLVRMPKLKAERSYLEEVLKRINEEIPNVIILVIGSETEEETKSLGNFRRILNM